MIVISREQNQGIVINDNVIVTVIEILDDKVRLGIECPKEMPVHRREVFAPIHRAPPQDEAR